MIKFQVIDTETTGLGDDAQVVELGVTCVYDACPYPDDYEYVFNDNVLSFEGAPRGLYIGFTDSYFVKPTVPVEIEALATHHITPDLYEEAGSWDEVLKLSQIGEIKPTLPDVLVAHNADYDKRFFTSIDKPWICTFRCAYELIRDAPSHKNGVLRYFLNLPVEKARCEPAHRAGPDTYVTAHILAHLLTLAPVDELIAISSRPRYLRKLGFGEHADKPIEDVPSSYFSWMRSKDTFAINSETGKRERVRAFDVDKSYTAYRELVRRGLLTMHPDASF